MSPEPAHRVPRRAIVLMAVVAYFLAYPDDIAPVRELIASLLGLSFAVSPWLYGVIGVGIVAWTIDRVWGRGRAVGRGSNGGCQLADDK